MTEPFPFGEQDQIPVSVEDDVKDRRPLIALGAGAVLALAAGAFFLLSGGEEAEETFVVPSAARPAAGAPAQPVVKAATLPTRSTVQLGRNPFRALYVAASGGGAGSDTSVAAPVTPTTTTPDLGGAAPIVVVNGGGNGMPTPTTTTGPTSPTTSTPQQPAPAPAPARSTVKLTGVSTKTGTPVGTFVLDGKTYTGKAEDVLGGKLLVISLQQDSTGGWFANLQVGDGSPFEVHERQEVVVQ